MEFTVGNKQQALTATPSGDTHANSNKQPAARYPGTNKLVFITAGPMTKLFAGGRRILEYMCYETRRAETCLE